VGQRFIQLLDNHPWFQVTALAASDRSTGQRYADACHWLLSASMPEAARDLVVQPIEPGLDCRLVFSALPSSVARPAEQAFAQAGYAVCTNASPHRMAQDVPLLIPEVNAAHTALLEAQRSSRGWAGLIAASANCTATPVALALKPLQQAFGLRKVSLVSMQAISGAGYPGVPAPDILGNVVPYIGGEEEKVEIEARKLLGALQDEKIANAPFVISAQCNRVPVHDGHTACLSVQFERAASPVEVVAALQEFRAPPDVAELPSSPDQALVVHKGPDRPQPRRDINLGRGMSVSVGRVRDCPLLGIKFVVLGHNTLRGAAGGAIHNAELLVKQGWIA
jgi:aspartate-semialdehyde dehydrogenase